MSWDPNLDFVVSLQLACAGNTFETDSMPSLLLISGELSDHFAAMVTHDVICLYPGETGRGEWGWLVPFNVNL